MANIVNDYVPERNKQTQQFTMSENTNHLDSNGVVEFNYSHDSCPTCQDRLIVVGSGGMWGSHLLWMLWFLLPWMSVSMGWSRRVGGEVFRWWLHSHKNEGWRYYAIKKRPQPTVQVFDQSFLWTIGKRYSEGTSWLLFEGGSIPCKKRTPTKFILFSSLLLNILSLLASDKFSFLFSFIWIEFLLLVSTYVCHFKNF